MKISVIMPFYNCEKYLDESIKSILNQTFSDFEFIIINDASTDNSDEIVKKYLCDKRIIYIKNDKNIWIVQNLNKWINLSKGEYIARMDWDDISLLNRFEKQISFLENNKNIWIVWTFVKIINEKNQITSTIEKPTWTKNVKDNLFLYLTIIHWSALIRKETYIKVWLYREKYLYTEDNDWTYRAIFSWICEWDNIPEYLYLYRKHSLSSNKNSNIITKRNFELRKEMIKKYNLKISLKGIIGMYIHYILWILLNWKQKEKIEYYIKKLIIK